MRYRAATREEAVLSDDALEAEGQTELHQAAAVASGIKGAGDRPEISSRRSRNRIAEVGVIKDIHRIRAEFEGLLLVNLTVLAALKSMFQTHGPEK